MDNPENKPSLYASAWEEAKAWEIKPDNKSGQSRSTDAFHLEERIYKKKNTSLRVSLNNSVNERGKNESGRRGEAGATMLATEWNSLRNPLKAHQLCQTGTKFGLSIERFTGKDQQVNSSRVNKNWLGVWNVRPVSVWFLQSGTHEYQKFTPSEAWEMMFPHTQPGSPKEIHFLLKFLPEDTESYTKWEMKNWWIGRFLKRSNGTVCIHWYLTFWFKFPPVLTLLFVLPESIKISVTWKGQRSNRMANPGFISMWEI